MSRPAELGGGLAAVAFLVAHLLGVTDAQTLTALGTVVGFVPAVVTWLVVTFKRKPATPPPAVKP